MHLVRYIDFNPVQANLAPAPALYPFGSATWYASLAGPPWLARDWVEERVRRSHDAQGYDPSQYPVVFGNPPSKDLARLIELRLEHTTGTADHLHDLVGASSDHMLGWMQRKASLADGTGVGLPICDGGSIADVLAKHRTTVPDWIDPCSRKRTEAWPQVHAALLRDLCGSTWAEVALRTHMSEHAARRSYARHQRSLSANSPYAAQVSKLAKAALDLCHASRP
jgi:hypothetical protein